MTEDDIIHLIKWASEKSLRAKNEPLTETQRAYLHYAFMDYIEDKKSFEDWVNKKKLKTGK